jgi:hypothetical protein
MSTIKSSADHLTINADGASKDIKFQANGVQKASISSAGAFTSTTIDATVLTGALPAISGAALTGVGATGLDDVSGVARATSGLLFNADTAAANTLDDYEEGTWTPTFILRDTTYGSTSYSDQAGYYTKIGNEVFVSCFCRFSAWSGGSNNEVRMTGFPFTNANTAGGVMPLYGSNPTKRASSGAWAGGTTVEFYYNNGTTFGNLVRDDFAQNTYVRLTTTYNV